MLNIRLHFSKTGDAKYLSHLDLMRCFTRAVKQSGIPVWYTEGFNTHIYLMFACPLSLGFESTCDTVDLKLTQDDAFSASLGERINAGLPQGVEVFNCTIAEQKHTAVAWSRWHVELTQADAAETAEKLAAFLSQSAIPVVKKTKKGIEKTEDAKPLIGGFRCEAAGERCVAELVLSQRSESALNPSLLLGAFSQASGIPTDAARIVRTGLLDEKLENFR